MFLAFSFAIIILAGFVLDIAVAEYDCSAKDDGWYYDPEFCHIYWRCIHGTAEEFECASGTAWDHHANRCNWLDSIDCSRAEKTTPEPTSDDDDGSEPIDGHGNHVDEGDDAPPTVVKRPKLKKTKNRKPDSEKRMLGADKKKDIDDDDRENDFHIFAS